MASVPADTLTPAARMRAIGGVVGLVAGFAGGVGLVLWQDGRWAGNAVAWLGAGALLMLICLPYVAFS